MSWSLKGTPNKPRSCFQSSAFSALSLCSSRCQGSTTRVLHVKRLARSPRGAQPRWARAGEAAVLGSAPRPSRIRGGRERGRGAAWGSRGSSRSREEPSGAAGARTCRGKGRPRLPALPAGGQCWGERSSGSGCGDSGLGAGRYLDRDRAASSFLPICPDLRLVSGQSCVPLGGFGPGCALRKRGDGDLTLRYLHCNATL